MGFVFYQAIFSYARDFFEAQKWCSTSYLNYITKCWILQYDFWFRPPQKMQKNGLDQLKQELAASEAQGKAAAHRVEVEGREAERYFWRCLVF